nr:alginate export family protein [Sphingomonas sp. ZFBP2030]
MGKMRAAALATAGLCASPAAHAQQITLKPLVDARLRWEDVDQDDLGTQANAVTLRLHSGVAASSGRWSALAESEATLGIVQHYNDALNGRTSYPIVADPQNIELNRAQLRYATPAASITIGRQLLELGDQRFVGSASFRQNQQTFDAVRTTWQPLPKLSVEASYVWSVRTINGIDGRGARQQAMGGNNWFGTIAYATPIGSVSGFAILVDQDEAAVQGYRLSSQTYGARLSGSRAIIGDWKLGYVASVARQSDYHRNPNDYAAAYYLGEATLGRKLLSATIGYELLGADRGQALTSVQTPLASLFKFQGWADKFTTTPANGLRDLYGSLGAGWPQVGALSGVTVLGAYHRFDSDRADQHYGNEVDLLASARYRALGLSVRYAHYDADRFAANTDKLWLTMEWSLR